MTQYPFARCFKKNLKAGHQWLTSIILATQEAEIRRIVVQSQSGQTVHETLSQKHPSQVGGGRGCWSGSRCRSEYHQKKKKKKKRTLKTGK
jgi:hypothetical protein